MPGRNRVPSFQIASGTTAERDNSYNIPTGSIFYNTDTSNIELSGNVVVAGDISATNVDISGSLVVGGDSIYKLDFGYAKMDSSSSVIVGGGDPADNNPNQFNGCIFGLDVDITPNRSGAKVLLNYNINGEWTGDAHDKLTYIAVGIVDPNNPNNSTNCSYNRSLRAIPSDPAGSRRGISGFMIAFHNDYGSTQESSIGQFIDDDINLNPNIKYRYTPVLVNATHSGSITFRINQTVASAASSNTGSTNERTCSSMVAQILGYT